MPQYKVIYFDVRGLGETIRQLLVIADQPFEDIRIPLGGLTDAKKKELDLEWGQVPVLDIDGVRKSQSFAIARYLAKKYNLVGKNETEEFRCDEVVEAIRDFVTKTAAVYQAFFGGDNAKLDAAKKTIVEVDVPLHLGRFENILASKGNTWLVGDSITWADIVFVHTITSFETAFDLCVTNEFPSIQKLIAAVQNNPKIKAWLAKRPETKL